MYSRETAAFGTSLKKKSFSACRYGRQLPENNHKQVGAFRVTCTAMSSEKCRGIFIQEVTT